MLLGLLSYFFISLSLRDQFQWKLGIATSFLYISYGVDHVFCLFKGFNQYRYSVFSTVFKPRKSPTLQFLMAFIWFLSLWHSCFSSVLLSRNRDGCQFSGSFLGVGVLSYMDYFRSTSSFSTSYFSYSFISRGVLGSIIRSTPSLNLT